MECSVVFVVMDYGNLADCRSAQTYILALSAEVLCFLFSFGFVYLQEFLFWKSDT